MTRDERRRATRVWAAAHEEEIAGAQRRALVRAMQTAFGPEARLRDLLLLIGEDHCDLAERKSAGHVRLGDLIERDGEGPYVYDLLTSFGLDLTRALESAEELKLPLAQRLTVWL